MTVLAEKGYHAARVDDIVSAADVSHGTFYLYFANKEELVLALAGQCADARLGALVGRLGDIPAGPAGRAAVRAWLAEFVAIYRALRRGDPGVDGGHRSTTASWCASASDTFGVVAGVARRAGAGVGRSPTARDAGWTRRRCSR